MLIENLDYRLISGTEHNPYGRQYVLLRDYKFFFRTTEMTIPEGYQWDGPSGVPFVGTINNGWLEPSLIHDYLYEEQERGINGVFYTRQEADEQFFADLRANNVSNIYILIIRWFLDDVFQRVWEGSGEGASTVVKRGMVPIVYAVFIAGFLITSGLLATVPSAVGFLTALL